MLNDPYTSSIEYDMPTKDNKMQEAKSNKTIAQAVFFFVFLCLLLPSILSFLFSSSSAFDCLYFCMCVCCGASDSMLRTHLYASIANKYVGCLNVYVTRQCVCGIMYYDLTTNIHSNTYAS